ncbi:MAG TPA: translation elongation factor Ts [Bacteroidales bacterium]|nr:translation elongation factor Ts [Bacteroidales bacterium]
MTASEVNKLRQMTGAGMMDCKAALIETDGDFEKAIDFLRKKGQKVANKRADKEANEGIVIAAVNADHTFGVVVRISCETDFVAKNEEFTSLANKLVAGAIAGSVKEKEAALNLVIDGHTFADQLTNLIGKTGEKMELSGYESIEAPVVSAYNHQGNRLATLLSLNMKVEGAIEVAHEIAMQVAAMNPISVSADNVPADVIERELEIGRDQARAEGKPEAMIEKIAQGKLNKFYKDSTLLQQDFIRDAKKTVAQRIAEVNSGLTATCFKRLQLGE